jgi:hypothetical protein
MASRKEQKERLKAERLEREREASAAERRKRLVGYGAGGVLVGGVIVALVVVLLAGGGDDGGGGTELASTGDFPDGSVPAQEISDLDEAARAAKCRVIEDEEEGNTHTDQPVEYEANPPTSGDHFPVPAEDGVYTDQPEIEQLVHSHEHGRIVIQFDPNVPDSVKGDLKALYDEDPYHMILTPNATDMPYEVAATTWTRTLGCPQMNEEAFDAIRAFRDEYRDEGPEFVP